MIPGDLTTLLVILYIVFMDENKGLDETVLRNKLLRMDIGQIKILSFVDNRGSLATLTTQAVADMLDVNKRSAGARLSALARTEISGSNLLEPRGRVPKEGLRWTINKDIRNTETFKRTLRDIMEELEKSE